MVIVLGDTALTERGDILEVNFIKLSVVWVAASPIAESGLVTLKDVLLDTTDVVSYYVFYFVVHIPIIYHTGLDICSPTLKLSDVFFCAEKSLCPSLRDARGTRCPSALPCSREP